LGDHHLASRVALPRLLHSSLVPSFCRHNRLIHNCPICAEDDPNLAFQGKSRSKAKGASPSQTTPRVPRAARAPSRARASVKVQQLERAADDGYHCGLAIGVRSTADAQRLAHEIALASGRLAQLATDPPGLYLEVATSTDIEEATWLAFLIAYLSPLDVGDPFEAISGARVTWASGDIPSLETIATGPRSAHDPARGSQTIEAYRAWAQRSGSQAQAFAGEEAWTPGRRFSRVFERLALPGFHRAARYDLLVSLGRLGRYEMRGETLILGGADDDTTAAAKRIFGIGDTTLLERRSAELASEADVAIEALDLAIANWGRGGQRVTLGVSESALDQNALASALSALGL